MAEWKEPFERFMYGKPGSPAFHAMSPMFIVTALTQNLLSGTAITAVAVKIDEGDEWTEEKVNMGAGGSQSLLDLSISMLEQSYKLATSTYDEPHLAIFALHLICRIGQKWPQSDAIVTLQCLAATSELAKTRVYLQAISSQLPVDFGVAAEAIVPHLLHDFRSLVQRKHYVAVPLLLNYVTGPNSVLIEVAKADVLEFLYLLAEYFLGIEDYGAVVQSLEPMVHVWGSDVDEKTFDRERRRIQLCVARAYEVLGLLSLARELYLKCGQDDAVRELNACMAGDRIFLSKSVDMSISQADNLATRQLPDGPIAIFCRHEEGQNCRIKFFVFDQRLMTLEERSLPHDGMMWKKVMVVQDQSLEPLRLLVAPIASNSTAGDKISEIQERFDAMFNTTNADQPVEYLEVWEYQIPRWHQIITRGSRPDSYAVTRLSSHCAVLQGILVLFGGSQMGNIGVSSTSNATSSGVFILNFRTREWLRVPHPYRQSLIVDSSGRPSPEHMMNVSLPPFVCISAVTVDGVEAIALLRDGISALNEKRGNELVPKYALDLFGFVSDGSPDAGTRPNSWWMLDVETQDRSGYIATLLQATAMQIGPSLVVMGSMIDVIQRLNADGTRHLDFNSAPSVPTAINALDMRNMEWRGVEIHNSQLLTSDAGKLQFVKDSDPNNCHLVAFSAESEKLQIFSLSGLNSVECSFTEPLSKKRLLSKKNTLSYQLRKSQERSVRALRECANCRIFESAGTSFQCCARCRIPFYCSRTCQSRHWKKFHKTECVTSTTVPKADA